jgi:hypothetical protein
VSARDAAAIDAAEIHALSREADRRREELGETLHALRKKLAESASLRGLAEAAAERAAARIRHTVGHAVRNSAPANGAAALTSRVVRRTRAAGPQRAAVAIGVPAVVAAAAVGWWLLRRTHHPRKR